MTIAADIIAPKKVLRKAPRQHIEHLPGGVRVRHCRNCDDPIPKGCRRTSYCSDECATEFEIKFFPSRTRVHVFARDKGVCAICGCDTEKLRRILNHVRGGNVWQCDGRNYKFIGMLQELQIISRELGFGGGFNDGDLWQADHIHECARGGWGKGLDNFRTLCTPCHLSESARLARELAEERKRNKAAPQGVLPLGGGA